MIVIVMVTTPSMAITHIALLDRLFLSLSSGMGLINASLLAMEEVQQGMDSWVHAVGVGALVVAMVVILQRLFLSGERRRKLPPGPRGWPIVGNLLQLGSEPHRAMAALHKQYGHILYLKLGSIPTVVVDSPELVAEIMKVQDNVFSSRPRLTFTDIVAYDGHDFAMAPYGPHWRYMRRVCVNELLTPKRLDSTARERSDEIGCMVAAVAAAAERGDAALDMRELLARVSMNSMVRMILGRREFSGIAAGAKSSQHDFSELIHEIFRLMGVLNLRDFVPWLGWLDLHGYERDMHMVRRALDEVLDAVIQEHRDLASGKLPGGKPNDFVSCLLELPGEDGSPNIDEKSIKAIIIDMMAGGTDTSAVTNEWAMAEIVRNAEIQRKLQKELDSVVGRDRNVMESDLPNLPYLMCIVKEAFRLHPAGSFSIPRESMADTTINGYFIPKGTRVLIHIFSLGRTAGSWTDPLSFRPERWCNENLTAIFDPALRILPFGYGRRQCPGYNLGTTMVLFVLARLFHGFEWKLPEGVTADSIDMKELYGLTTPLRTRLRAVPTPRLAPHLYAQ